MLELIFSTETNVWTVCPVLDTTAASRLLLVEITLTIVNDRP